MTKIAVDLTRANIGARVNAVQGDGNTRSVEITLLSDGRPWTPPEGVDVAIAYYQPGGYKGLYNILADGTQAITISGNVATIVLAPQMLTASGTVQASLVFNDAALNRLTTFPFSVSVASNPAAGAQKTEDYLRLQWLEDKLEEYLAALKASGVFDGKPGRDGVDGKDGAPGRDGADGKDGAPGADGHTPEYGVDYGTPEQIAGIAQQAAEILQPEVSQIKSDLSANEKADADTRRKLDYLWKLNQGISYQFETDDTAAYSKTVPSGAKLASVGAVGGKTVVWNQLVGSGATSVIPVFGHIIASYVGGIWGVSISDGSEIAVTGGTDKVFDLTQMFGEGNAPTSIDDSRIAWIKQHAEAHPEYNAGELVSAQVESIKHNDVLATEIPMAIRILSGYGWSAGEVCNSIERTETGWQYVQRVGYLKLNDCVNFSFSRNNENYPVFLLMSVKTSSNTLNIFCNVLPTLGGWDDIPRIRIASGLISFSVPRSELEEVSAYGVLNWVKSRSYDIIVYYELAEPIITDITDLMYDFPAHCEVEAGGTLSFENAAKLPVPSTEKYLIALAEVNQ